MYSLAQKIEFENIANPHSWFLVSSELHEQAKLLKQVATSKITKRSESDSNSWLSSNRSVILLAGFALENVIKAYLVYENPEFVAEGALSREIQTHRLTKLANRSQLLPYKVRGLKTLTYYEDGLESWARYPCGLNWTKTREQSLLDQRSWDNYLWLMRAYELRFKKLMKVGWKGDHDFAGRFEIEGNWLS
ncbi:MAG TPA: hypothetical protein EYH51_16950 [Pseudomonas pachastrellae]|nr:hypothetical protein [Halopseudomonas pachastrellae]|tara:strand:- start:77 stop:649 length:573 start_codon:yes stop_codon:yes gene_type:complete